MGRLKEFWIKVLADRVARRFEESQRNPQAAQSRALRRLLAMNAQSEVGRACGFDRVRNPDDMYDLPPSTPQSLAPFFERARKLGSESRGIFGRSAPLAFIETSGSTGRSRFVPVNRDAFRAYNRSLVRSLAAIVKGSPEQWTRFFGRPYIAMTSVTPKETAPGGLPVGYGSAVMELLSRAKANSRRYPTQAVREMEDWEAKMEALYLETKDLDICAIMGFPRYVEDFTAHVLKRSGKRTLRELWPNVFLIVTGAVKTGDSFKRKLAEQWAGEGARFGRELHYLDVFSSTEGQYAVSWDASGSSLTLDLLDNFYQFREPRGGRVLQIHEVQVGVPYELLITTPGGLVNFSLGDLIVFRELRPYRFEFGGRVRDEISLAGEQLSYGNFEAAFRDFELETGRRVLDFAVWAESDPRRLHIVLPRSEATDGQNDAELIARLDAILCRIVDYYGVLRKEGFYLEPTLDWVEAEFFRAYRTRNFHRGQFKGRQLFSDPASFRKEYALDAPPAL